MEEKEIPRLIIDTNIEDALSRGNSPPQAPTHRNLIDNNYKEIKEKYEKSLISGKEYDRLRNMLDMKYQKSRQDKINKDLKSLELFIKNQTLQKGKN